MPTLTLNQLTPSIEKIAQGLEAMTRISAIVDRQPLISSKPDAIKPEKFNGVFKF